MKRLGIVFSKNVLSYSLIEGSSKIDSVFIDSDTDNFQIDSNTIMSDFKRIFKELITKYQPDEISYKISEKPTLKQLSYMHYSIGVLKLICEEKKIKTVEHSTSWFTKKLQGKKKIDIFLEQFPKFSKNNELRQSGLLAWFDLGE